MSEWKEYNLGELVTVNERSIGRNFMYEMVEYIDTSSVTENNFEQPFITTLADAPSRAKRLIRDGDTIISTVRPIQKHYGFIKKAKDNQVVSTGFAVVTPKKIEPRFLYYFLTQAEITEFLNTIAEGGTTTFPAFRADELKGLSIFLPDLPTQTAIAEILSSLDDKIELNNKINQELENLAQTLFKQWFIDFEFPNENGEPYKSSGGEMVESELGEIPKGWMVEKLMNRIENTKLTPKSGTTLQNRKYVPIDKMAIKSLVINNYSPIEDAKSSLVLFEKGDILLGAMRVYFHRVNYCPFDGVTRTTCFVLRPYQKSEMSFFLLYLNQNETIEYANRTSKGTTMPYAVWEDGLAELKFVYPTSEITNLFNNNIKELLNLISENIKENIELTNLRNSILPKLISGELEINEINN